MEADQHMKINSQHRSDKVLGDGNTNNNGRENRGFDKKNGDDFERIINEHFSSRAAAMHAIIDSWADDRRRARRKVKMPTRAPPTMRQLILKRISELSISAPNVESGRRNLEPDQMTLDTPLAQGAIANFDSSPGSRDWSVSMCEECHYPKIRLNQKDKLIADDFFPESGRCPRHATSICTNCSKKHIMDSLYRRWWENIALANNIWLRCAYPSCEELLADEHFDTISAATTFQSLLGPQALENKVEHAEMFYRAQRLREELKKLSPIPTDPSMQLCWILHERLVHAGLSLHVFGVCANDAVVEPYQIRLWEARLDGRRSMQIPVFTGLMENELLECCVCAETFSECSTDTLIRKEFRSIVNELGITGISSIWDVNFPAWQDHLHRCPPPQVCRTCLASHIDVQVQNGRSCVNSIHCPYPNCDAIFTHNELRRLCTTEVFEKYDRYSILDTLSGDDAFRWCLGEGCDSGAIYDVRPDYDRGQLITCNDCGFAMCFKHQVPWHEGMTCDEYDYMGTHGDPKHQETQDWIGMNTKPCPEPSCGIRIQKGEACFHMTCSTCRHQFCWECLASWDTVYDGRGNFTRSNHNEGCYFRRQGAPDPTSISGNNLQKALRRIGWIG